eukprot:GHUV01052334.1.p1 GENE.GHUV01052334.1~~GHUV01052334.1.p1  ORF type:complete len:177 (+),score=31.10 GHUV01052334.1:344-874(+)
MPMNIQTARITLRATLALVQMQIPSDCRLNLAANKLPGHCLFGVLMPGTPSWVTDRRDAGDRFNNHNWVEIWDGNSWSFTGACEYNPAGLNRTWFFPQPAKGQLPGHHWYAIYAPSYKHTGTVFPLAWSPKDNTVPGIDVTQAYIDADIPPPSSAAVHSEVTAAPAAEMQQQVVVS